jgi:RNA polymerase sigma-70 factor (ECF subfamily)
MLAWSKSGTVELLTQNLPNAAPADLPRLTRLMRLGDEDAYREFFRRYFHRLLAYLLSVTSGNETLARDLVQQPMLKIAKHIRVFEEEEAFWRWLTVLARTTAIDEGRKSQRYFAFLERWWHRRQEEPITDSGTDRVGELLSSGFEKLDPEERAVLEKKYLDDCSVREIAADLGLSEKAVESRLTRARAKLKQLILEGLKDE